MKRRLFKMMVATCAVAMFVACDDSASSSSQPNVDAELSSSSIQLLESSSSAQLPESSSDNTAPAKDPCAKYKVVAPGWIEDIGGGDYLVIDQATAESGKGIVYDADGNVTSYYFYQEEVKGLTVGHVYELIGGKKDIWIDMNMAVKRFCEANTNP